MNWSNKYNIILASGSPRRAELLTLAGFKFTVRTLDIDESYPSSMPVVEVAEFLAVKKAEAQRGLIQSSNEVVIAADSVVIYQEELLGKPANRAEALRMISLLAGTRHSVITGVCLLSLGKKHQFSVCSEVFMDEMEMADIEYYIDTYLPYDKAGSYGIQEWIGLTHIEKIEGSYTNIMGLPMQALYRALKNY